MCCFIWNLSYVSIFFQLTLLIRSRLLNSPSRKTRTDRLDIVDNKNDIDDLPGYFSHRKRSYSTITKEPLRALLANLSPLFCGLFSFNSVIIYAVWLVWVNSLWPSDAKWRHRFGSTLAQVMACCLTAPSHYLNQCWLHMNEVLWYSHESNFTANAQATILYLEFENYTLKN